jgi:hypothetical protein
VIFNNHHINSAVCTSSRSVIYTGQHIQYTKLFDNLDFPWSNSLDPEIGTLGDRLGEAGYYAAYKSSQRRLAQAGERYIGPSIQYIEPYFYHYITQRCQIIRLRIAAMRTKFLPLESSYWLNLQI